MADLVNTALTGRRETKTYETEDGTRREYRDVSYSFFANPMSGDVGKALGATAVKNSLLSIIKTNHYERLFNPEFGSNIHKLLFEPMNDLTVVRIKSVVEKALTAFEPRANVLNVNVEAQEDKNRYKVSVLFDLGTELEAQLLETLLEQV